MWASSLFLLVGNAKLPKRRRAKQQEINGILEVLTRDTPEDVELEPGPGLARPIARLNRNLGSLPMIGGNAATLIEDYEDSLRQMAAAVDAAQNYVLCEFYILVVDATTRPFFDSLEGAVKRGVDGARAVRPHRIHAVGRLPQDDDTRLTDSDRRGVAAHAAR